MLYFSEDDIAQIGTAPGPGLVGALRLSGPGAFAILGKTASGLEEVLAGRPRRSVHTCRIELELVSHCREGGALRLYRKSFPCPARAFLMPAPASYTREDVVELHLAASPAILRAGLAAMVRAGARPAAPGEFTFRAFRNGRLSLGQAEAVEGIIRAVGENERCLALSRLGDGRRDEIEAWRRQVTDLAARLEMTLDFPDTDPGNNTRDELAAVAGEMERSGLALDLTSQAVAPGLPHVAIVGLTNAGKSSLFNALLDDAAALVSPLTFTTRDHLRREVEWDGVRLELSDNPGPNRCGQPAGDRTATRLSREDIVCWVLDASHPASLEEETFADLLSGKALIALNKCDLPKVTAAGEILELAERRGLKPIALVEVSAKLGTGVDTVRKAILEAIRGMTGESAWNQREAIELSAALEACRDAACELAGPGRLELAADDLRRAEGSFSRALGEGYAEEVLTRIFSCFCIGK
ncbi:MAG: 50S ribosome-binding GTPase [Planctomycetes bacterium]|nr:50S ribosome-binding GTPase [Planctomycetota bacterium]